MTLALIGLVGAIAAQQHAPQLRTNLPSGAIVLAENMAAAKSLSVQLFASSRGVEEIPARHGWRHLLEHLILKGRDPKSPLDIRSEAKGIFVQGRTFRHAMQLELTAKPEQLDQCLDILREVTRPLSVSTEEIAREVEVMREEIALTEDSLKLGMGAWNTAYGRSGLDPQGNLEAMAKATPDDLTNLMSQQFTPKNLVLVISGPVDVNTSTAKGAAFLSGFHGEPAEPMSPADVLPGRAEVDGAFGEGRAIPVTDLTEEQTVAVLIGAFGIAARVPGAFVSYTPAMKNGLVIVGQTEANGGVGRMIDDFTDSDLGQVYAVGNNLYRRWIASQFTSPSGSAALWGHMLLDRPMGRLDDIRAAQGRVTFDVFRREFGRFRRDKAVTFVGSGR